MRMGNPSMRKLVTKSESGNLAVEVKPATYGGVTWKSVYFAALTIIGAVVTALLLNSAFANENEQLLTIVLVGAVVALLPMLIISIIVAFAPATVKVLGSVYALIQGAFLGILVFLVDAFLPGVAFAAVLGTMIVFVVAVVMNKMLGVKVGNKAFRVLLVAFLSFIVCELILFVCSLFVANLSELFTAYLWLQVAASGLCIIYATIMLLFDLQSADAIVQAGADKRYEWSVAFSLVMTLVYLYVEILELIIRLLVIFGKNKN